MLMHVSDKQNQLFKKFIQRESSLIISSLKSLWSFLVRIILLTA